MIHIYKAPLFKLPNFLTSLLSFNILKLLLLNLDVANVILTELVSGTVHVFKWNDLQTALKLLSSFEE